MKPRTKTQRPSLSQLAKRWSFFGRGERPAFSPRRSRLSRFEQLEDRRVLATVDYAGATDALTFTADVGDTDNVTITVVSATQLRINVTGGDTITLSGGALANADFVLSAGNTQLDIANTQVGGASQVALLTANLGNQNDTLTFTGGGFARAIALDFDGEAGTDTLNVGGANISGATGDGLHADSFDTSVNFTGVNTFSGNTGDGVELNNVGTVNVNTVGAALTANTNSGDGLRIATSGAVNLGVNSAIVSNFNGNTGDGIDISSAGAITFDGLDASNNTAHGIRLVTVGAVAFTSVTANGNDPGAFISGAASFSDTDGTFSNNDDHGILLEDISGNVTLTRTTADDNDANTDDLGDGVKARDGADGDSFAIGGNLLIRGGRFRDTAAAGAQISGVAIDSLAATSTFTVQDAAGPAQSFDANGNSAVGLVVDDGGTTASITNGTYSNNGREGIVLDGFTGTITITGIAANFNGLDGVLVRNSANVNISTSTASDNDGHGYSISNVGAVTTTSVTANSNDPGILVSGAASYSDTDGTFSNNDDHGIQLIDIAGDVTLIRATANDNDANDDGTGDGVRIEDGDDGGTNAIGGNLLVQGGSFRDTSGFADPTTHQINGIRVVNTIVGTVTFQDSIAGPLQSVNASGNEAKGVDIDDGGTTATFTNGTYSDNGSDGIQLSSFSGLVTIDNVDANSNGDEGFDFNTIGGLDIDDSSADDNDNTGLEVETVSGNVTIDDSTFNNNGVVNATGDGIEMDDVTGSVTFVNVTASGNDPGVHLDGAASFSDTNGTYDANDDGGVYLLNITGAVTLTGTTATDNDANQDGTGDGLNMTNIGGPIVILGGTYSDPELAAGDPNDGDDQENGIVLNTSAAGDPRIYIGFDGTTTSAVTASGNQDDGIDIEDFLDASLDTVTANNNGNFGFEISDGSQVVLADLTLTGNNGGGEGPGGDVSGGIFRLDYTTTKSPDATADTLRLSSTVIDRDTPAQQEISYAVANLNVYTGLGDDTIDVEGTSATTATQVFGGSGDDTITIAGSSLANANSFFGDSFEDLRVTDTSGGTTQTAAASPGNDEFTLNIISSITASSLTINGDGNAPAGTPDSANRDRLVVNDSGDTARQLDYIYLNAQGGLNIAPNPGNTSAGLFGANLPGGVVQVRTMETYIFNDTGAFTNNDIVRVFGATDDGTIGGANPASDILTAALLRNDTSVLVFRDGMPYLGTDPVTIAGSLPGVAGGGDGPDMFLNGLDASSGLTFDGNGAPDPGGDRAVVYAKSEDDLVDPVALAATYDIFGFGDGVLQPGNGTSEAYDDIDVDDGSVITDNNIDGLLTRVFINTPTFVQNLPDDPSQQAALIVNGGDEADPDGTGIADDFNVTTSTEFNIQVNGNLPGLTKDPDTGAPQGDRLNVTITGAIDVFSDNAAPPNVTVKGAASTFGVKFSSIEIAAFAPTNGVVNLIGDNNDPNVDQNDYFRVRGGDFRFDPDLPVNGQNQFVLQISGNWDPLAGPPGTADFSPPIYFSGVQRINASGGEISGHDVLGNGIAVETNTGVDALDITPWADNTPRNWGIETYWNEGDPSADGGNPAIPDVPDLLVFNGVAGVSDAMVIAPSDFETGQVYSNNAATGTPIAVVNYILNSNIIINGNDGALGDSDSLLLLGTNQGNAPTSGNDRFELNLYEDGTPLNELIRVTDPDNNQTLYFVQDFSNLHTLRIEALGGNDTFVLSGVDAPGGTNRTIDSLVIVGGTGDDSLTLDNSNGPSIFREATTFLGGEGRDSLRFHGTTAADYAIYTVGPNPDEGEVVHGYSDDDDPVNEVVFFTGLEPIVDLVQSPTLVVNATNADNAINYGVGNPGGLLALSNDEGELIRLDLATGSGTFVGDMPNTGTEIEYDPATGKSYLQLPNGAFEIQQFDSITGAGIGGLVFDGGSFNGLEFVGGVLFGTFISSEQGPSTLATLNPTTGAFVSIGLTGVGPISGLAYDPATTTMYGIAGGPGPANLYTIDLATGVATVVGSTGIQAGSLEFGPDGLLYAGGTGSDSGNLYVIDPATGGSTLVGATGFGLLAGLMTVTTTAVISIDAYETYEFANKTNLIINALNGSDTINLNNPTTPVGLTTITVNGGDPTAGSDTVVVNGTSLQDEIDVTPTAADAATIETTVDPNGAATALPLIQVTGTEHLNVNGQGGNDEFYVTGDGLDPQNTTSDYFVHTPGAAADAGHVALSSTTIVGPIVSLTMLGVSYQNLGLAGSEVEIYGGGVAPADIDTLVILGTGGVDTLSARFTAQNAINSLLTDSFGAHVPVTSRSIENYELRTLEGADLINLQAPINATGTFNVYGGGPSGGIPAGTDALNLVGALGVAETVNIAPTAANPLLQSITGLGGAGGATIVAGEIEAIAYVGMPSLVGAPDDTLTVDTGIQSNTIRVAGGTAGFDVVTSDSLPTIAFTRLNTFTLNPNGGADVATFATAFLGGAIPGNYIYSSDAADVLIIEGRDGATAAQNDSYTVTNPTAGVAALSVLDNTSNTPGVTVTDTGNTARLQINTLGGDDLVTVNVAGAASDVVGVPITFDGGVGRDTLTVTGAPVTTVNTVTYTPGPAVHQGRLSYVGGAGAPVMQIDFLNLEPVFDLVVAGSLIVNGTNANNAINYGPGSVAANGLVSVDAFETIEFSNKGNLTLNGLAGDDIINISNFGTPTALTGVTVNGGNPGGSDVLVITGTAAAEAFEYAPTGPAAGTVVIPGPDVTFTETESVVLDGGSSANNDTLIVRTPAGVDVATLTPGANLDSGTFTVTSTANSPTTPPLAFKALGGGPFIQLLSGGAGTREDIFVYQGTASDDTFNVTTANGGTVILGARKEVRAPGANNLILQGLDGDDTFGIPGDHPFAGGLRVEGGNPSASDIVNFTGSATVANLLTVDFGANTVVEAGSGTVSLTSVEILNVLAATHSLTVRATGGNDTVSATPTGANEATVVLTSSNPTVGATPVVNGSNIGTLTVDMFTGSDTLTVNGTQAGEAITVTGALVTVGALETVNYTTTENLRVLAQAGDDTITVTPAAGITMFIDGGDPIGSTPGDRLITTPPGAYTVETGPENDEGGMSFVGAARLSWDKIEALTINGGANPGVIVGTGADDDITIIARDASTHAGADGAQDFTVTVNSGPEILFLNTTSLNVDAGAGDDDIVVREPSPTGNVPAWNVQLTIAGGPPAAATGSQGDVFLLETPGTQTVVYSPLGVDTATINDTTNTSLISLVNTFTIAGLGYTSQPGGVEHVIYQGLNGGDTLTVNGTGVDDTFVYAPANGGTGSHASNAAPAFSFNGVTLLNVNGGAGGFDHLIVNGTNGPDVVTSPATDSIAFGGGRVNIGANMDQTNLNTFDGLDNITLDLDLNGMLKVVDAGAGNDIINMSASDDATIFGGIGDDSIIGTPVEDLIYGGSGNDVLIGGAGNDTIYGEDGNDRFGDPAIADSAANDAGDDRFFGGEGSDTFVWDPGDNNDLIEGGGGSSDVLIFNGSAAVGDTFTLSAVGTRLLAARLQGAVSLDVADVENVNLNGLDLADTFTINDLYPTAVQVVNVNFGAGDGDNVTINGRDVSDQVNITPVVGVVEVTGLRYDVNVSGAGAGADAFTFNGNNGNDNIVSPLDASLTALFTTANFTLNGNLGDDYVAGYGTLNGNEGNDTLVGGSEAQTINGGDGNDQIFGGSGIDNLNGGAGEDVFVPGFDGAIDVVDGGADFDTILVQGTSANNYIDLAQDSPTQIRYNVQFVNGGTGVIPGAGTETDTLASGTVEEVKVLAGSGDDHIRVTQSDSLIANAQQALTLRFTIDAGAPGASDRLTVMDDGFGDTTIQRIGGTAGTGSFQIGLMAPVVYFDTEYAELLPIDPVTGATGGDGTGDGVPDGRLYVFKHDPYESNNSRLQATFLGSNSAINVDPTIDPATDGVFGLPGDEDWYRIVAQSTGDLDIRVFFAQYSGYTDTNGVARPGLPGDGNLDIALYDGDATPTLIAGTGTFGTNDTNDNERIRIPAVAGQTYYLRVKGAALANTLSTAVNVYNVSVLNTPTPTPFDLELDDIIGVASVDAAPAPTATVFDATAVASFTLNSTVANFYQGKDIVFTSGNLIGQRRRISAYDQVNQRFTVSAAFTAPPAVGSTFQIESADTGRSQLDNITRDTTPTIFLRIPNVVNNGGAAALDDVPNNGSIPQNTSLDSAPDNFLPVPFNSQNTLIATSAGFRVPIFVTENGTSDLGAPNNVLAGYAQPVDPVNRPGLFSFTFGQTGSFITDLASFMSLGTSNTTSFFISARTEIIDPSQTTNAQGYGAYAQSLEIVVDTQVPPVFFGLPNVANDGLLPDSDSGIDANPHTLDDEYTNDTTPGFFGQAEADTVIRLYVDFPSNPDGSGDGIFNPAVDFQVGFTVAQPFDGTNQYADGYWQIDAINYDLNAAPFPIGGPRTFFVTAEDVAGNIGPTPPASIQIFIDTQGPQVTGVFINSATQFYALTGTNSLVSFSSTSPNVTTALPAIAGIAGGFTLQAIDILPSTFGSFNKGTLFGLATNGAGLGRVYSIVPGTGATSAIGGTFSLAVGTGYGFDFNPTNNLLRITSGNNAANSNVSFNITTGTATSQTNLSAAGVAGSAYDRNDADPTSATTLYGIDSTGNNLVRQGDINGFPSGPGGGVITTIGALGVDTTANVGFDIVEGTNFAYAALDVGGDSGLYQINLVTGEADLVGVIGNGATTFVGLTAVAPYDLFDPKPSTDGPTPLANSLVISFRDLPPRTAAFLQEALKLDVADTPGIYQVKGDYNGIIPIQQIIVTNQPPQIGQPALATVELVFRLAGTDGVFNTSDDVGAPLPDDRYTLTVLDNIIDLAGNHLDGESNASEPQEFPSFPTGDGINGGNFVARFTIDSRPELGVYAAGSAWVDTNGNNKFDPDNLDYTNRDITYVYGYTSDDLFAGKFVSVNDSLSGNVRFDKLGAYGRVGTSTFRWMIDTDNDGVADVNVLDPSNINGMPVAGNFDASFAGDEVGVFTGSRWYFDTDHNWSVNPATSIAWAHGGYGVVGDFDGDGIDDLASYENDTWTFDLSSVGPAGPVAALNNGALGTGVSGTADRVFKFGFIGAGERPVVADMNQDGIEDVGLWVPAREGVTPRPGAEWYFLVSGVIGNDTVPGAGGFVNPPLGANIGPTITGGGDTSPGSYLPPGNPLNNYNINTTPGQVYGTGGLANGRIVTDPLFPNSNIVRFQPVPFGNDLYMQFGDEFAMPLVGNFDPPVTSSGTVTNTLNTGTHNTFDVTDDGLVNAQDILALVNFIIEHGFSAVPTSGIGSVFYDVNNDLLINAFDILGVINYMIAQNQSQNLSGGEGEGEGFDDYFADLGAGRTSDDDDLLGLLAAGR